MRIPILSNIHNKLNMDSTRENIPFSCYPRPTLVRDSFINLNGEWNEGVLVPYPLESAASGYGGKAPQDYIYERKFVIPKDFIKDKVILHFDAVDCCCEVFVNGSIVGKHAGGYNAFSFDITRVVSHTGGENSLKVIVTDKTSKVYPRGKQKKKRGGMWYTTVTGIWKSVWIESVSEDCIEAIEITPSLTGIDLNIESDANDYSVEIYDGEKLVASAHSCYDLMHFDIENPHLWTPDDPYLYDIVIRTKSDEVNSYFGLRTVTVDKVDGVARILLNGEPFFFHGVLNQGYFPEGIYTANCEKDYADDIKRLKELGINTIRQHIKVEPECFYEACDRLGMLVFQDMVNNGSYSYIKDTVLPTLTGGKRDDTKFRVKDEVKEAFVQGVSDTMTELYNHPSVVYYTVFNEGWGQFDADMLYEFVKGMDPTRIVDTTSGWFKQNLSDVESLHVYFKDANIKKCDRPVIISEFGGFSYKIPEHSYSKFVNYGYGSVKDGEALTKKIVDLYERSVVPAISVGLCGTIYTQFTDVEDETNGFYTYDRKICKVDKQLMKELADKLKIGLKNEA